MKGWHSSRKTPIQLLIIVKGNIMRIQQYDFMAYLDDHRPKYKAKFLAILVKRGDKNNANK